MDDTNQKTRSLIHLRNEHPAWRLLAARRAPSVLASLQALFEQHKGNVDIEEAVVMLSEVLRIQETSDGLEVEGSDYEAVARKELRQWIKLKLIVERQGQLIATDALQKAFTFVDGLSSTLMSSTASRLSTVQREIESLESGLNPDPSSRISRLERKIEDLERELDDVREGNFDVLAGGDAIERIRDVYYLATSLRSDFRRVEDSYREADHHLRQSIISDQQHRGEVVDRLLDSHDELLETPEGRVFHGFHQQLSRRVELDEMNARLATILGHLDCEAALDRQQQVELRWLSDRLVKESEAVIRARSRSEKDVKGFIKTGLAAEHHRIGQLLQQITQVALELDWSNVALRRTAGPLSPIAIPCAGVPAIERLRFKVIDCESGEALDLSLRKGGLDDMGDDFWASFDSLDRKALFSETVGLLESHVEGLTIADLASHFSPRHDLEAVALWLSLAMEAELPLAKGWEQFELGGDDARRLRFTVPRVTLNAAAIKNIEFEV